MQGLGVTTVLNRVFDLLTGFTAQAVFLRSAFQYHQIQILILSPAEELST